MGKPFGKAWFRQAKDLLGEMGRDIRKNDNLRSPSMWAVWLVPTVCVPTFRYIQDKNRPAKDRFKISVRDFAAYAVGTILFFTFSPASSTLFKRYYKNRGKTGSELEKAVGFATTVFGSLASALYSGFGAMPFAQWVNRKFLDEKPEMPTVKKTDWVSISPEALKPMVLPKELLNNQRADVFVFQGPVLFPIAH